MTIGTDSLLGLALFVGAYIVSRIVHERALKRLNTEQKAELVDAFAGYRTYFMSAAVGLPLLYFVAIKLWPVNQPLMAPMFVVSFGLLLVITSWLSFRKLKRLTLPPDYIRSFLISSGLQYIGIAFLCAPLLMRFFS